LNFLVLFCLLEKISLQAKTERKTCYARKKEKEKKIENEIRINSIIGNEIGKCLRENNSGDVENKEQTRDRKRERERDRYVGRGFFFKIGTPTYTTKDIGKL
jgi:hypothetical protein